MSEENLCLRNNVVNHVTQNFEVFGFSNYSNSLFQCCKELIDNSIAACQSVSVNREVSITLNHDSSNVSVIQVEVVDNGCGISDLDYIVELFASKRVCSRSGDLNTKAKYGVGLTTCLMYAQIYTGRSIRIITKIPSQQFWSVLDVAFDMETGSNKIVQETRTSTADILSGTRICLSMPFTEYFADVVYSLQMYLYRWSLLPSTNTTTRILAVSSSCCVNIQCTYAPTTLGRTLKLYSSSLPNPPTSSTDMSSHALKYNCEAVDVVIGEAVLQTQCSETESFAVYVSVLGEVVCSCRDMRQLGLTNAHIPVSDIVAGDEVMQTGIPLELWRYANGSPILDENHDSLSCGLTSVFRSVPWIKYGQKLEIYSHNTISDASREIDVRPTAYRLYPCLEDDLRIGYRKVRKLVVIINVMGSSVSYTSLRKTSLNIPSELCAITLNGICTALQDTHLQLLSYHCHDFSSRAERMRSQFQHQCLSVLGLPSTCLDEEALTQHLSRRILGFGGLLIISALLMRNIIFVDVIGDKIHPLRI